MANKNVTIFKQNNSGLNLKQTNYTMKRDNNNLRNALYYLFWPTKETVLKMVQRKIECSHVCPLP